MATTPADVAKYVKQGLRVVVEKGAGEGSSIADAQYVAALVPPLGMSVTQRSVFP